MYILYINKEREYYRILQRITHLSATTTVQVPQMSKQRDDIWRGFACAPKPPKRNAPLSQAMRIPLKFQIQTKNNNKNVQNQNTEAKITILSVTSKMWRKK